MEIVIFLALLVILGSLAMLFGADSRYPDDKVVVFDPKGRLLPITLPTAAARSVSLDSVERTIRQSSEKVPPVTVCANEPDPIESAA